MSWHCEIRVIAQNMSNIRRTSKPASQPSPVQRVEWGRQGALHQSVLWRGGERNNSTTTVFESKGEWMPVHLFQVPLSLSLSLAHCSPARAFLSKTRTCAGIAAQLSYNSFLSYHISHENLLITVTIVIIELIFNITSFYTNVLNRLLNLKTP